MSFSESALKQNNESILRKNKVLLLLGYIDKVLAPMQRQTLLTPNLITKVLYLCDWKFSIEYETQMTNINWRIIGFEPVVDRSSLHYLVDFVVRRVSVLRMILPYSLSQREKRIAQVVIDTVKTKEADELSQLVYSTYPAISQDEDQGIIDMGALAKEYQIMKSTHLNKRKLG